jgi:hypothetical protein
MNTFSTSYAQGRSHEERLCQLFPRHFELLPGTSGDIRIRGTGELLELKAETRSLNPAAERYTDNIFVEVRTSSGRKLGGPFKALQDGCAYYAVLWATDERLHVYPAQAFADRATEWCREHRSEMRKVWTEGNYERFFSEGFPIPREWFAAILIADVSTFSGTIADVS